MVIAYTMNILLLNSIGRPPSTRKSHGSFTYWMRNLRKSSWSERLLENFQNIDEKNATIQILFRRPVSQTCKKDLFPFTEPKCRKAVCPFLTNQGPRRERGWYGCSCPTPFLLGLVFYGAQMHDKWRKSDSWCLFLLARFSVLPL